MASPTGIQPFNKPWTGDAHAYPVATSLADAIAGLSRTRKGIHTFILREAALADGQTLCAYCGKVILPGEGNRGLYSARQRRAVMLHYSCSWQSLLEDIFRVGRGAA